MGISKSRSHRTKSIVPLYEHIEKLECRESERDSFELCTYNTWYTFGDVDNRKYSSIFQALDSILSDLHISQCNFMYSPYHDEKVEKLFIGRIVQKNIIEKQTNFRRHYCEKKIVALFSED